MEIYDSDKPVYAVVLAERLNLRELPTRSNEINIIHVLEEGDRVQVEEISGEWAKVYMENGLQGYVMREFIYELL